MKKSVFLLSTEIIAFILLANIFQSVLVQLVIFFKSDSASDQFALSMWVMSNGLFILSMTIFISIASTLLLTNVILKQTSLRSRISSSSIVIGSILLLINLVTPLYKYTKYWEAQYQYFNYLNVVRDLVIAFMILLLPRYWLAKNKKST